jgi:hypothetical protein
MSTRRTTDDTPAEFTTIGAGDPRYRAVVDKRFNKRFGASPDYVRLVGSSDQVVEAVQEAVSEGRRLVVTSGGHCLGGFVSDLRDAFQHPFHSPGMMPQRPGQLLYPPRSACAMIMALLLPETHAPPASYWRRARSPLGGLDRISP